MKSVLDQPLAFVDIETTGGSHFTSRVLEVGVVRVEHNRVVASYQTLLHPDEPIPSFITGLTGITDEQVADSPKFATIAPELAEILDGAVFVAHSVRFDYSFLKREFERIGVPFRPSLLCTVRLSRKLFPEFRTHKLGDLITRFGLSAPSRHRAYDDAHCLWQFYQVCLREFDLDTVEGAVKAQLASQSIPSQLDRTQVEALPEGPGVYIFEDESGAPLYVGKSITVKRRVISHFSADYEGGTEQRLASQVKSLRGIATHGELSALLLESDLIKDLQPEYNRQLRRRSMVTMVLASVTTDGYMSVEVRDGSAIRRADGVRLLAVYTSMRRAKQSLAAACMRYRLCPKVMGLERTNRACFQSHLGKCDRACVGVEDPLSYNERVMAAFERQRVVTWPYPGTILIREQHPALAGSAGYLVDDWCIVGRLREFEDGTYAAETEEHQFDLDRYRIIRHFLENPRNRRLVTSLSAEQLETLMAGAVV